MRAQTSYIAIVVCTGIFGKLFFTVRQTQKLPLSMHLFGGCSGMHKIRVALNGSTILRPRDSWDPDNLAHFRDISPLPYDSWAPLPRHLGPCHFLSNRKCEMMYLLTHLYCTCFINLDHE